MVTKRAESLAAHSGKRPPVNDWALRKLSARAATFLQVVGAHAPIRAAMSRGGYGPDAHAEGLRLLVASCDYQTGGAVPELDRPVRAAAHEVLSWARTHCERLNAALKREHPDTAPLMNKDELVDEPSSILLVGTMLERLNTLAPDAPVLHTLQQRGLDAALRERLSALVRTASEAPALALSAAEGAANDAVAVEPHSDMNATGTVEDAALLALHAWYTDWSATARTFIRRKDWLLRLGLTERRGRKEAVG